MATTLSGWTTLSRTTTAHFAPEDGAGVVTLGCGIPVYLWTRGSLRRPRPGDHVCQRCAKKGVPREVVQAVEERRAS